jgi:reactive intermediate/imine deaminase
MPRKTPVGTIGAPAAIGPYSQAIAAGGFVFLSGQIAIDPVTQTMAGSNAADQARQVFRNLGAVAEAAGGSLVDVVKLTVYLVDLTDFPAVNAVMEEFFTEPYPARATVGVAALPRAAAVEVDAIMVLHSAG